MRNELASFFILFCLPSGSRGVADRSFPSNRMPHEIRATETFPIQIKFHNAAGILCVLWPEHSSLVIERYHPGSHLNE